MTLWKDVWAQLDSRRPLPPLKPEYVFDEVLSEEILAVPPLELLGYDDATESVANLTRAGLLVWNDDLDAAHALVQSIDTPEGSYWHAILHRREGDYDNAKYWFHRVGEHRVFEPLYEQASRLWPACTAHGRWSPNAFVDAVSDAVQTGEHESPGAEALRRVQIVECTHLLRYVLSGMNL